MSHWYLVLMGQAERVLMEWTCRRIEVLEQVLPPARLDQVNEAERARTAGTGGIPPPQWEVRTSTLLGPAHPGQSGKW